MQLEPLDVYKVLGDETRYELFSILLESPLSLSTAELAARLQLHPNTIRPHLERMRQVGLVELEVCGSGTVGRPTHRYRAVSGITGPPVRLVGSDT